MNTIDKKGGLDKAKRQWVFSSMTLREFQEKYPGLSPMALKRLMRATPKPLE